jgi:tRNA(fMet)-specific endonuclease VapC
MLWILDTDHISLLQRRNTTVLQKNQHTNQSNLAVTVISYEEQVRGWLKVVSRSATNLPQLALGYRQLNATLNFFSAMEVLEFSDATLIQYQSLVQQKLRIGTQDLRIAAIVLAVGGILVTRNLRDFQQVPGLQLEDWSS